MAGLSFRILLDSVKNQEIIRDILISDHLDFEQFYIAILDAFGLENDQMASFYVSDEEWNKGEEISLLDMAFDSSEQEVPPIVMSDLALKERIKNSAQRFILVHDFLSMWIFLIELQEVNDFADENPQLIFSLGEIPENLKQTGANDIDDLRFDSDFDDDDDDYYQNGYDDLDEDYFENIDDYDF